MGDWSSIDGKASKALFRPICDEVSLQLYSSWTRRQQQQRIVKVLSDLSQHHNSGIIIFHVCYATINPLKSQRMTRIMGWSCYSLAGESVGNLAGRIVHIGENGQHT